jgi:phosphoglycolate phosphatase
MTKQKVTKATVIFDFDGTIADSFEYYFATLNILASKFGFRMIDTSEIDHFKNLNSHQIIDMLKIPRFRLPFIVWEARKLLRNSIGNILPIHGMKDVLSELRNKDILLGVITSNSVKNVKEFLEYYHLAHFDFIFSSLRIWEKSRTLKKVIYHNKLNHDHVFYIGDETRDIEASKDAGIKSVAVTWGYNSENILKSYTPDFLISNPHQILDIIDDSLR